MAWNPAPGFAFPPPPPPPPAGHTAPYQHPYPHHQPHHPYQQQPYQLPPQQPYQQPYQPPPIHPQPATSPYTQISYPYIPTAKRQMTLLSPDRSHPLLTVIYPSSWSTTPQLTVHRGGGPDGPEIGGALFHSFTTGKVDAYLSGVGDYRFRKKFVSLTGLGGAGGQGGRMEWGVENKTLVLSSGDGGGYVARFVLRDGADAGKATSRVEGTLVVMRGGLTDAQFGEVVVTMVAEMERKRRDNEDFKIAGAVIDVGTA
ncbi:hypothetical protein C8A01DRAFT_38435 [Parachaetomium inaequale]|uniref:Uncharacterized protein n=1 Tax=Parachaetomium inaequale TaxID=2588326 RepID=A0AAN6SPU1_9PEZI|nr:hypothetical protein C8A01DRAFT_38435 [Parachaetomium inaequale]